ncbi:hypothetical protein F0310_01855 [Borrelia sp. A-FGy1]|nr:hypothetical protein [Borrelia sp. A-FGy1]QMU99166.1 hypothetical protein F0310_01855 [Borrelia sp. A-FGy1]
MGLSGLGAIEVAKEMGEGYYIIGVDQDRLYLILINPTALSNQGYFYLNN